MRAEKRQTDVAAHQSRIPKFDSTPVNGWMPAMLAASRVIRAMSILKLRLANTSSAKTTAEGTSVHRDARIEKKLMSAPLTILPR
jgi:hypothetical protein